MTDELEAIANEHFRGKCYLHQDWLDLMHSLRAVREQTIKADAEVCERYATREKYGTYTEAAARECAERILAQLEVK